MISDGQLGILCILLKVETTQTTQHNETFLSPVQLEILLPSPAAPPPPPTDEQGQAHTHLGRRSHLHFNTLVSAFRSILNQSEYLSRHRRLRPPTSTTITTTVPTVFPWAVGCKLRTGDLARVARPIGFAPPAGLLTSCTHLNTSSLDARRASRIHTNGG